MGNLQKRSKHERSRPQAAKVHATNQHFNTLDTQLCGAFKVTGWFVGWCVSGSRGLLARLLGCLPAGLVDGLTLPLYGRMTETLND